MSKEKDPKDGLPPDPSLGAFAAATQNAFAAPTTPRPTRPAPQPTAPVTTPASPPGPVAAPARRPAAPPRRATPPPETDGTVIKIAADTIEVFIPALGDIGATSKQTLVNVDEDIKGRFTAYCEAKKREGGGEPPAGLVVRRAYNKARKEDTWQRLLAEETMRSGLADDEDDDPDGLLGDVEGRRATRGSVRVKRGFAFRPSRQELALFDAIAAAVGFSDRGAFVNAILHDFLPSEVAKPRRRTKSTATSDS
ncbi:hypothetical protein ACWDUL_20460 [Nocardia niigatensis]